MAVDHKLLFLNNSPGTFFIDRETFSLFQRNNDLVNIFLCGRTPNFVIYLASHETSIKVAWAIDGTLCLVGQILWAMPNIVWFFFCLFFNSNAPISPNSNTYCVMGKDIIFIVIGRPASALAFSKGKKFPIFNETRPPVSSVEFFCPREKSPHEIF